MTKKNGFTLIELLVVIAIIALLLSIVLPSLQVAKRYAAGVVCISNDRSLSTAWFMYAQDNNNRLVGANSVSADAPRYDWSEYPQDENGNSRFSSVEDHYRGIRAGKLFAYTEDVKVYHCVGDKRMREAGNGAYQSYSIQGYMNGGLQEDGIMPPGTPDPKYNVKKYSEIKLPSSKVVFVEEARFGYNWDNWALQIFDKKHWTDPLAIWHNRKSTLGFADGHAELHRWVDDTTIEMSERPDPSKIYAGDSEDLKFMLMAINPK
jgi:prepilin-type N-terminal cleavage/methylation domain-containing protein/prepilin-type processing-associated H-X9-DG protein